MTINSFGEVTWEVIRDLSFKQVVEGPAGDEKRVKKLEEAPGWSPEKIIESFGFNVVLILDGKPFGFGYRSGDEHMITPYHMGPLHGKDLELCGVADYVRYGSECTRVSIDVSRTEITTLDFSLCRSKTGFDSMLVKIGRTAFSKIGVKRYNECYDKSVQGEIFGLGFDMSSDGDWKKLVVHSGKIIQNTNALTAVTGTFFHTLNTEAGWSGTPLVRFRNGQAQITGMHISALPGPLPYNIAVTSPMLERLICNTFEHSKTKLQQFSK